MLRRLGHIINHLYEEKFLEKGIPYNDIDPELIELIYILNFKSNLKTSYCCSGHGDLDAFYLMFDESVHFEMMDSIMEKLAICTRPQDIILQYYVRNIMCNGTTDIRKNWVIKSNGRKSHQLRLRIIQQLEDFFNTIVTVSSKV